MREFPPKRVGYLAMDDFRAGKKGQFLAVVTDLESDEILRVAEGRGKAVLSKLFRRLRWSRRR